MANVKPGRKTRAIKEYVKETCTYLKDEGIDLSICSVGNEIDYGICGVFASNKKKRKNLEWLKRNIWSKEAHILNETISTIKDVEPNTSVIIHIGKWWDFELASNFILTMEERNVQYDMLGISFYPTGLGASFEVLESIKREVEKFSKKLIVAEYAYPSKIPRGQFWFMNKPVPGYPFSDEGQAKWIKDRNRRSILLESRTLPNKRKSKKARSSKGNAFKLWLEFHELI